MKDGGRNELRPYGAGKFICCAPNAERFPGFVGGPYISI